MSQQKPVNRAGASAGGGSAGAKPEENPSDLRDLFLSEEQLIRLAMGQLRGRRPPRVSARSRVADADSLQSARKRRQLAAQLKRELTARCWTALELSEATRLSVAECRALVAGSGAFTADVARALSRALATSEDLWMSGSAGDD